MSEKIVQLNEEVIKGQIKELVRGNLIALLTVKHKRTGWQMLPCFFMRVLLYLLLCFAGINFAPFLCPDPHFGLRYRIDQFAE